jgi:integrase
MVEEIEWDREVNPDETIKETCDKIDLQNRGKIAGASAWKNHRNLINSDSVPSIKKVVETCKTLKEEHNRLDYSCALAIIFLTGSRISEVIGGSIFKTFKYKVDLENPATFRLGKMTKNGTQRYIAKRGKRKIGQRPSLKVSQIKVVLYSGVRCLKIVTPNLKHDNSKFVKEHPLYKRKIAYIPTNSKKYKELLEFIDEYDTEFRKSYPNANDEDSYFPSIVQSTFGGAMERWFDCRFHIFRHSRASDLSNNAGLSDSELKQALKWTPTSNMASLYSHAEEKSVIKKLLSEREDIKNDESPTE